MQDWEKPEKCSQEDRKSLFFLFFSAKSLHISGIMLNFAADFDEGIASTANTLPQINTPTIGM